MYLPCVVYQLCVVYLLCVLYLKCVVNQLCVVYLLCVVYFISISLCGFVIETETQTITEANGAEFECFASDMFALSLLGLLAKIKCSICSYQFNI